MELVYEYSVLQLVPCAERMERLNVGVMVYCRSQKFVGIRTYWNTPLLNQLFPFADLGTAKEYLVAFEKICNGSDQGPLSKMDPASRFRWLTAPRNTMLQSAALHTGLTSNAKEALDHLFQKLVLPEQAIVNPKAESL